MDITRYDQTHACFLITDITYTDYVMYAQCSHVATYAIQSFGVSYVDHAYACMGFQIPFGLAATNLQYVPIMLLKINSKGIHCVCIQVLVQYTKLSLFSVLQLYCIYTILL